MTSTTSSTSMFPDDDWDTLGGLIFNTLEHVPIEGEFMVDQGWWRFTVIEMEGRRIKRVMVTPEVDLSEAGTEQPEPRSMN